MHERPVSVLRPAGSSPPAAFERLYREQAPGLERFLLRRTGDAELAEDLVAETFLCLLRSPVAHDPQLAGERTWLYAIALNCLRAHWRRCGAEERALARLAGERPSEEHSDAPAVEERDRLRRAMAALPAHEREALVLRFGADLRVGDIAGVTGQRVTTIAGRLHRGMVRLRSELAGGEIAAAAARAA